MNKVGFNILNIIPAELMQVVLTICIVVGGLCLVVGARKAGFSLILTGISFPIVSLLMELLLTDFFTMLPEPVVPYIVWSILGLVYLVIFASAMQLIVGEKAWVETKANLLTAFLISIFSLLFNRYTLVIWLLFALFFWLKAPAL